MNTVRDIKQTIMTEYWGEVISFFVTLTLLFAVIRQLFIVAGQ